MDAHAAPIDIDAAIKADPIRPAKNLTLAMWLCVVVGVLTFFLGFSSYPANVVWGSYYVSLLVFMGIAVGSVMITAIFQITRATWAPPVRRLAEANVSFLPIAYVLLLVTYFGREELWSWGRHPLPGREAWLEPGFVFVRFAVLMGLLFLLMFRFVGLSLRADVAIVREKNGKGGRWHGWMYDFITSGWRGADAEVLDIQRNLSRSAPILIMVYAVVYSLFAFEMVMEMNGEWMSNLFGAFLFIGNVYIGWAMLSLSTIYHSARNPDYAKVVTTNQLWDLGKLTFGFCMIWGYFFFSQFLPQWYGNLPEETQWMILRTRQAPWNYLAWFTFTCAFICPFVLLIGRDIKKSPPALATVSLIILVGYYCEKYVVVMPEMSPHAIPFSALDVGIFLGFLGMYVLSIQNFMARFPFLPVSHPTTRGNIEW